MRGDAILFLALVSGISCVMKNYSCDFKPLTKEGRGAFAASRAPPLLGRRPELRTCPVASWSHRAPHPPSAPPQRGSPLSAPSCLAGFGNHHSSACHGSSGQLLAEVGRTRGCRATSGKRLAGGPRGCLSLPGPSGVRTCSGRSLPPPAPPACERRRQTFLLDPVRTMRNCRISLVGCDQDFFKGVS